MPWGSCFNIHLTHWARVTHICVGKLTKIGSDNGLSPERRQAVIWTNAVLLLIGPLGTNFSGMLIEIQTFSLKKIRLKMSSAKCCSFRLGLNEFITNAANNDSKVWHLLFMCYTHCDSIWSNDRSSGYFMTLWQINTTVIMICHALYMIRISMQLQLI